MEAKKCGNVLGKPDQLEGIVNPLCCVDCQNYVLNKFCLASPYNDLVFFHCLAFKEVTT